MHKSRGLSVKKGASTKYDQILAKRHSKTDNALYLSLATALLDIRMKSDTRASLKSCFPYRKSCHYLGCSFNTPRSCDTTHSPSPSALHLLANVVFLSPLLLLQSQNPVYATPCNVTPARRAFTDHAYRSTNFFDLHPS